jgi:hypothetical protein
MNCAKVIYPLDMVNRLKITEPLGGLILTWESISMAKILAKQSKTYIIIKSVLNLGGFNIPIP